MDDCRVWTVLEEQGRMVTWLGRVTGISPQRLGNLRRGLWWRHDEVEAVSRALGVPRSLLFGPRARVLPPGRRRWKSLRQAQAQDIATAERRRRGAGRADPGPHELDASEQAAS